jgi:hypothetical protein
VLPGFLIQYFFMNHTIIFSAIAALSILLTSCDKDDEKNEPVVISASGLIEDDLNAFRQLIGEPLNTTPGNSSGRREVNWDGVPADLVNKELPLDFFNPTTAGAPAARQRGLAYTTAGGQFRVSNTGFADVNGAAASQFSAFSGDKVFANISSNLWQVSFQVPGQNISAGVNGFGAVFSDVDQERSTSLEFFNGSRSLGKFFVPPHNAESSFSFLGVYFKGGEKITNVAVNHNGNLSDGQADVSDNGTTDHVVLDDFIYGEPVAD